MELTTPTGAALLAALASGFGPMPPMTIESSGFGAGTRDLDGQPNATQVVIGAPSDAVLGGQPVVVLEVNVDDATGETLAHTITALLEAGAHDAWVTPIVMKKGRPAHTVSALADTALSTQVAEVLARETGSLGVRGATIDRWPSARETDTVEVAGFPVRVKVSPGRVKVEHDDAARVAGRAGLPLREVISLAEEAGRRSLRIVPEPAARPARPRASPPLRSRPRRPRLSIRELFLATARHDVTVPAPVETCEACRFDGAQYDLPDTIGTLRALGQMWRWAVEDVDSAILATRPEPSVWSALEYAVHSAEVAEIHTLGLEVLLGGDDLVLDDGGVELGDPDTSAGMAAALDRLRDALLAEVPSPPPSRTTTRAWKHTISTGTQPTMPPGSSATPHMT